MEDERYQKELFEFKKPKRFFPRLSDIFPRANLDNRAAITVTLERFIFIAIGLIMLMVVIYALGVERGKDVTRDSLSAESRISLVSPSAIPGKVPQRQPAALPVQAAPVVNKPYSIFAATFTHQEYAAQAMNDLKKAGFNAFLSQSGSLFRLCVGSYASKDAAMNDLVKVRRVYKDAFVKVRETTTNRR